MDDVAFRLGLPGGTPGNPVFPGHLEIVIDAALGDPHGAFQLQQDIKGAWTPVGPWRLRGAAEQDFPATLLAKARAGEVFRIVNHEALAHQLGGFDRRIHVVHYTQGQRIVDIAMTQLGVDYVFGGVGPDGEDCSGLSEFCIRGATGIAIPHNAQLQYEDPRMQRMGAGAAVKPGWQGFMHVEGEAVQWGHTVIMRDAASYIDTEDPTRPCEIRFVKDWAPQAFTFLSGASY